MSTQRNYKICALLVALMALAACKKSSKQSDDTINRGLVVNEIVAKNQTGIMAEDGNLYDWIELKNISKEDIDLSDYALAVVKKKQSAKASKEANKPTAWKLPNKKLKPGELIIVYASKKGNAAGSKELHADFKLPADKSTLQLQTANGTIVSELCYAGLEADQCYRRLKDGTYEASYLQSPGFENTNEGFEQYNALIDSQRKSPLRIWEAHTKGDKSDMIWVEVKNVSDASVNLSDYNLACDTKKSRSKRVANTELAPGEIYVVSCKEDSVGMNSSKSIVLTKNGKFMDGVCGKRVPFRASVGRVEGQKGFFILPEPSRGNENNGKHYRFLTEEPTFNIKPGVYNNVEKLVIKMNTHGHKVHFTKDGSTPSANSPLFKDSLVIDKTTMIRYFAEGDSVSLQTNVTTATYFVNENHTLPVINITINNSDLYDYHTGIYVKGPGAEAEYPHMGANYWKPITKSAHVEFYDSIGSFSMDCGFAIFGGFSRTMSKKSFKLKFKDIYGPDRLTYDLFNEGKARKFKNFVLRSGSQDACGVMVRDEFFTSLMKENSPSLLVQAYRPVVLYINAEYFGVYFIREKVDRHYVAHHLGVSNDSVNIIMSKVYNEEGPKTHYQSMLNYVRSHDMNDPEAYKYMQNLVDFNGLIDQKLGEIYSGNTDVGNIRYVRSTDDKSDKKWYFVFYDLDATWASDKKASFYLRSGGVESEGSVSMHNLVISKLLKNPDFRLLFLERLSLHMHKTFTPENTTRVFDGLVSAIRPEMERNCKRWPEYPSFSNWEKKCENFREKFQSRNKDVLDDLRQELKVTPEEDKKYFGDLGI